MEQNITFVSTVSTATIAELRKNLAIGRYEAALAYEESVIFDGTHFGGHIISSDSGLIEVTIIQYRGRTVANTSNNNIKYFIA
jgi:hypothetical protein